MFKERFTPTGDKDKTESVVEKKSVVLMTGTQMERPLRHLSGLIKEYSNDKYNVSILNLGAKAGVYEYKDGGYPDELREEVIDFIVHERPVVLGITIIDYGVERLSDLIKDISENENVQSIGTKIVAGGPFAIEHPERCIAIEGIDVVCYSKGWNFPDIVAACESGDLETVPGLIIKTDVDESGKVEYVQTPPPNLRITLAEQPFPDESQEHTYRIYEGRLVNSAESGGAIPVEHHQVPHKHTAVLVLSEGCPNDCEFCSIPKQRQSMDKQIVKFFNKPNEFVTDNTKLTDSNEEMYKIPKVKFLEARKAIDLIRNYLNENPKTEFILFNDNDFTARSVDKINEFCLIYKEEINLPFYCQCSPNTATAEKIQLLWDAGMDTLDSGVQGSEQANKHSGYERKCTDAQVLGVARGIAPHLEERNEDGFVTKDGLKVAFDFINGNEIHTKEDMLSTVALVRSLTETIEELTNKKGSWNLAIHNLTLDPDRDLAKEYKRRKSEEGAVSVGEVEDSDYHNATIDAFYKLREPYLNIVLEWIGGLHDQVRSGRLPKKTEDFFNLIEDVLNGDAELRTLVESKESVIVDTVDFLTDEDVYKYLSDKKVILKQIHAKLPEIYYSYQRPDRYDYDYAWAEEQLLK